MDLYYWCCLQFLCIIVCYGYADYWKERKEKTGEIKLKLKDIDSLTINILKMILGIILVFLGAKLTVNAVEKTAVMMKLSETFISILIIAVGTSLPEIFTSISAIKKGKHDIAVGNLIGSNMFNILFVLIVWKHEHDQDIFCSILSTTTLAK